MPGSLQRRSAPPRPPSLWRLPAARTLLLASTTGFTGFFLTLSSLPWWVVSAGHGAAAAGLVTGVMLGSTVLTQLAVPAASRRVGGARLYALGLVALGVPSLGYLLGTGLWWLVVTSALRGIGFAVVTVVGATLAATLAPPGRYGEAMGVFGLSSALPNVLAVPAGLALAASGHFAWVAVLAAAPVLVAPLAAGLRRAVPPAGNHDDRRSRGRHAGAVRAAAAPAAVLLVSAAAVNGVLTFLPVGRPDGILATSSLLALGGAAALTWWRAGVLADRVGGRLGLPAGACLCGAGLLLLATGLLLGRGTGPGIAVLAGATLLGAGWGVVQGLTLVAALSRAGADGVTTASAVWNAAYDGGFTVGALVVGAAASSALGLPWAYALGAVAVVLTAPLARTVARGRAA